MSKDKKNIASEALLEMNSIKEAIKEESKNTLRTILGDAVKDVLRESIEDDKDDDDYEVEESTDDKENSEDTDSKSGDVDEDVNDDEMSQQPQDTSAMPQDDMNQNPAADTQEAPMEGEGEGTDDEWSDYSQYQAGDENTYDLTGEQDFSQVVKVYKLMQNDDQVVVKKEGDTVQLTDNGTGAEYVIDLSGDEGEEPEASVAGEGEEMTEGVIKEGIFDDDDDDYGIDTSFEDEIIRNAGKFRPSKKDIKDLEDESEPAGFGEEEVENELLDDEISDEPRFDESKKSKKVMKENKQLVFEVDLGYTDNYQSKDPIQGLNNSEPSKSGKSWEKGVPTGTEKPWAGSSKDKGEPFEKTVNEGEVDECGVGGCAPSEEPVEEGVAGAVKARTTAKDHVPNNRKEHLPKKARHISTADNGYDEMVESYKKEIARLKKINEAYKKENAQLKECAKELCKNINESYVVNTNLAKITRLFTENAVSQQERIDIVNRFANEAKTVEQSKALYESINNELKKNGNKSLTLEQAAPASPALVKENKELNEVKKSKGLMDTLDLIKRMGNL